MKNRPICSGFCTGQVELAIGKIVESIIKLGYSPFFRVLQDKKCFGLSCGGESD